MALSPLVQEAALRGVVLAKALSNWCRKAVRRLQKQQPQVEAPAG